MNIYSHVTPQQAENTSQKLADYLNFWQIDSILDSIYKIKIDKNKKNAVISTFFYNTIKLTYRAFHFIANQTVQLNRVFHR